MQVQRYLQHHLGKPTKVSDMSSREMLQDDNYNFKLYFNLMTHLYVPGYEGGVYAEPRGEGGPKEEDGGEG